MSSFLRCLGCLLVVLFLVVLLIVGLAGVLIAHFTSGGGTSSPQGDNAVTLRARAMATHLNNSCIGTNPDCLGDAAFDAGFPQQVIQYGQATCPGCLAWQNDHFQCVVFVLAAYGTPGFPPPADWVHPLAMAGNANVWWGEYGTASARSLGYVEVPASGHGLPLSPGDIMAWSGGQDGHVSIVLGWIPPSPTGDGSITFAQANGEKPFQTLPIRPDYTIDTNDGYWNGFMVMGYIHPIWLPPAIPAGTTQGLPQSPYVQVAWNDAQQAGILPAIFVKQINQESGFNPNATSPAGAEGIAQFMPATAAGLGIDPWNPAQALQAAANMMARSVQQYGGDYQKALAAYNAGSVAVQNAINACGSSWLSCMPAETQHYVSVILS